MGGSINEKQLKLLQPVVTANPSQVRILEKRKNGCGILLVSSELSEIMTLSDRIYVLFEGKIAGEFKRGAVDEKTLGILMLGGRHD